MIQINAVKNRVLENRLRLGLLPETMKRLIAGLVFLAVSTAASAGMNPGRQSVADMGKLNGTALACRYYDLARRIKRILIDNLPKSRELGRIFEDRTREAFMVYVQANKTCPSPGVLEGRVDEVEQRIHKAFPNPLP